MEIKILDRSHDLHPATETVAGASIFGKVVMSSVDGGSHRSLGSAADANIHAGASREGDVAPVRPACEIKSPDAEMG
jgi:hypothetical protein